MSVREHPEWDLSYFISDMDLVIREIDDVLPNGSASRAAHRIRARWKAIRWNYEDMCDDEAVAYRKEYYNGEE